MKNHYKVQCNAWWGHQTFHSCTFGCGREWVAGLLTKRTIPQRPGTAGWRTGAGHTQATPAGHTHTQVLLIVLLRNDLEVLHGDVREGMLYRVYWIENFFQLSP